MNAQTYRLRPSGLRQVNEGEHFVFNCTVETGSPTVFVVLLDGSTTTRSTSEAITGGFRFSFGPVSISDDGSVLQCRDLSNNVLTVESATLDVTREY